MKLDQLIHFQETARHQHVGKAAKILRISPSGISYSIECLERDLGVSLFEKRGKRIFLTEAGRRLMQKVPEVQHSLEDLRAFVSQQTPVFQGHYRLGASHLLSEHILTPKIAEMFSESDQLSIEIFSLRSAEVLANVLDDKLDLGMCFSPQRHPRLENKILHKGQIKVYVREGHPLLKQKSAVSKLSDFPAALPKAFGGIEICQTHPTFAAHQLKVQMRLAYDHYGVATQFVENSDYWGFLPDWLESLPDFALRSIPLPRTWQAPYTIEAVWNKDRILSPGLGHFLEALNLN